MPQYDLGFYAHLVDTALSADRQEQEQALVDVGSGCGRLVLAATALWPSLRRVAGVEKVRALHDVALAASEAATMPSAAPACEFFCADAHDVLRAGGALDDADVLFAYTSAWASHDGVLTDFSELCGLCLRPGARVIVTDKQLRTAESRWEFQLIDAVEGPNTDTGGTSIGYVYEVVRSGRSAA